MDARLVLSQLEHELGVVRSGAVVPVSDLLRRMTVMMKILRETGGWHNNQFTIHVAHQDDVFAAVRTMDAKAVTDGVTGLLLASEGLGLGLTYVASDLVELLSTAAHTLETEPLRETDLFAPKGFCYLQSPLPLSVKDHYDDEWSDAMTACRAFSWVVVPGTAVALPQIVFFLYSDRNCYRDVIAPSVAVKIGDADAEAFAASMGVGYGPDDLFLQDVNVWHLDQPWDDSVGVVRSFRRFFLAMMRFCWQQLLVTESAVLSRPVRRFVERKGATGQDYNVLRLRRVKRAGGTTGEGLRLDHRVLVRGHWRNHHYPSLGPAVLDNGTYNAMSHRRIWIEPHVKGPDDAPLRVKHKVTVLAR